MSSRKPSVYLPACSIISTRTTDFLLLLCHLNNVCQSMLQAIDQRLRQFRKSAPLQPIDLGPKDLLTRPSGSHFLVWPSTDHNTRRLFRCFGFGFQGFEEFACKHLGCGLDHALAHTGDHTANAGFSRVFDLSRAVLLFQIEVA